MRRCINIMCPLGAHYQNSLVDCNLAVMSLIATALKSMRLADVLYIISKICLIGTREDRYV